MNNNEFNDLMNEFYDDLNDNNIPPPPNEPYFEVYYKKYIKFIIYRMN